MIYIVAKIIASDDFQKIIKNVGADPSASIGGAVTGADPGALGVMVNYILLIGLMIGSLIVAQRMGAVGSGAVMSWGKKLKSAGQGYAGKISKRYVGRAATAAQERLEKGEGKFAKTLKAVPFLQRSLAKTAQLTKKEVGKLEKQYGSYDTRTLEQLRGKIGTPKEAREAIDKTIKKRSAQKTKEENIEKENERHEKIEKELPKMEEWNEEDKKRKVEIDVELEINGAKIKENPDSEELKKDRYELVLEKNDTEKRIKEVDQMREEKKKIEENRIRRRETEGWEERIAKAEAGIEGIAAKKPKEAGPEKT